MKVLHQFILYPYVFSPLRALPGPRGSLLSPKYLLWGEFLAIMTSEAGVLQREWAKAYGMVLRAVGPFGIERVQCLSAQAMQKVLVDAWADYPRVSLFFSHIMSGTTGYLPNLSLPSCETYSASLRDTVFLL